MRPTDKHTNGTNALLFLQEAGKRLLCPLRSRRAALFAASPTVRWLQQIWETARRLRVVMTFTTVFI